MNSKLEGWFGLRRIGLATLPALVVGYLARHLIKEKLFTPVAVTGALAVGGVAILIAERFVSRRRSSSLDALTLPQAFGVGLFQVLALWPGTSRAAATIVGGMLLGLDRKAAAAKRGRPAVRASRAGKVFDRAGWPKKGTFAPRSSRKSARNAG